MHPLSEWIWKDAAAGGMLTATEVSAMRAARDEFRLAFARSWEDQDVDVVLGPAYVGPACAQVKQLWGETDFEGAPVNLQLVARKYHDNELFGAFGTLKDILGLA